MLHSRKVVRVVCGIFRSCLIHINHPYPERGSGVRALYSVPGIALATFIGSLAAGV